MAIVITCVVLLVIYLLTRTYKYKCPAPGCDFITDDAEVAQKHATSHGKHKPVLQEVFW